MESPVKVSREEQSRFEKEPTGGKRLVLVVHGIGDDEAGAAVHALARSIRTTKHNGEGVSLTSTQEVLWLPPADLERKLQPFPCHVERIRDKDRETVLAEVWWSDLSRVQHTTLATLGGLFQLTLGLRHLAWHASQPEPGQRGVRPRSARAVQWLCAAVAYLLRGPVLAATVTMHIAWALGVGALALSEDLVVHGQLWVTRLGIAAGLLSTLVGGWGCKHRRGLPWGDFFGWLIATGGFAAFSNYLWYREGLPQGFGLELAFALAYTLSLAPTLVVIFVLTAAAALWLFLAFPTADEAHRPGLALALVLSILAAVLLTMIINLAFIYAWDRYDFRSDSEGFQNWLHWLLPRMSIYWIASLGLGLILFATWIRRWRWAKATTAENYEKELPSPRLLLSEWAMGFVIAIGLIVPLAALTDSALFDYLAEGNTLFVFASVQLVTAMVSLLTKPMRQGLDLGLDVIARFRREARKPAGERELRVWKGIKGRFRTVLQALCEKEKPAELTIVAHSQGTIVSIDTLSEGAAAALLNSVGRCDLVTMGCPFHHLYQYYFPSDYPPLAEAHWTGLRHCVRRWVNIFRVDDPIGTHIEAIDGWTENHPVDRAGHTGYWTDSHVLKILRDEDLV